MDDDKGEVIELFPGMAVPPTKDEIELTQKDMEEMGPSLFFQIASARAIKMAGRMWKVSYAGCLKCENDEKIQGKTFVLEQVSGGDERFCVNCNSFLEPVRLEVQMHVRARCGENVGQVLRTREEVFWVPKSMSVGDREGIRRDLLQEALDEEKTEKTEV